MAKQIRQVIFTAPAVADLQLIFEYYAGAAGIHIANSILEGIFHRIDLLQASHIYAGAKEPALLNLKREYRRLICGNYKIIYRISKKNIYIIRIFDSRQSPAKMKTR